MCSVEHIRRHTPRSKGAVVTIHMGHARRTYTLPHDTPVRIVINLDEDQDFDECIRIIRDALAGAGVRKWL